DKLFLALGHHDLSAAIDSQPALETIRGKRGVPLFCEFCLETVSRVVEAGVQYAAVASAGVRADFALLVYDGDRLAGKAARKLERESDSKNARADDEKVSRPRQRGIRRRRERGLYHADAAPMART